MVWVRECRADNDMERGTELTMVWLRGGCRADDGMGEELEAGLVVVCEGWSW